MTPSDSNSKTTRAEIQDHLSKDLASGSFGELTDYLSRFPGSETEVAAAWLAATKVSGAAPRGSIPRSFADGRYTLIRELGRGGQGAVYFARDEKLKRDVAVKILLRTGPVSRNSIDRFRREALLASNLDHVGICPVFDSGEEDGVLFLVMKLVTGETMASIIADSMAGSTGTGKTSLYIDLGDDNEEPAEPSPPEHVKPSPATNKLGNDQLLLLVEKAARALHYAHEAGVIHRDVKPANIMVTENNDPVILDFGLARGEEDDSIDLSLVGEVFGTPAYMSPEQIEERLTPDHRTDIYSLGASLYEALSCQRLFSAPTRRALFDSILRVNPLPLRSVAPGISRDLEIIVHTAIEKDRDHRYQSAADFADDIERLRNNRPILAKPPGLLTRLKLWYRRDRSTAVAASVAFVILLIGIVVSSFLAKTANQERNRADSENTEYRRLADSRKLAELRTEARDALWPPTESMGPQFQDWIQRADALLARLPEHEKALADLRKQGRLQTVDQETERLSAIKDQRNILESELNGVTNASIADAEKTWRTEHLAAGIKELNSKEESKTWTFESSDLGWRHDRLADLVTELKQLRDGGEFERTSYASVQKRLSTSNSMRNLTVIAHRDSWQKTIEEIAKSAKYGGLNMKPQVGLVPVGFNPQGLAEFVHLASGKAPTRDARGELVITDDSGIVLILVPGRTFMMGSPLGEQGRRKDELQHEVSLAPYFIGKYEVTQAQWLRIMGENAAYFRPGKDERGVVGKQVISLVHPVENIEWHHASDFAKRCALVLPTEARWELACRADSKTAFTWGANPDCLRNRANLGDEALLAMGREYQNIARMKWDDGWTVHSPVFEGAVNGFGLYGLHGNVTEWTLDRYSPVFPVAQDLPPSGENTLGWARSRTFRDGNFLNAAGSARSALRWQVRPEHKLFNIGVRMARDVDPQ